MPTTPNLLERDSELASIDALIEQARDGRAGLALVEGPAGIGKSRLLAELRRRAESEGFLVLTARGSEIEREFPFGIARQLFEPLLAGEQERAELLGGSAATAEVVFSSSEEGAGGDSSFAALNGLYWLAVNLSGRQPLLLAIDDLHWADASSLRFIAYLARRLESVEMLVATTLRTADPGTDAALLAEIANDPLTTAIQPHPLTAAAVAAIVRERLGEGAADAFCAACHETTGGNPLLLEELLRALASERISPGAESVKVVNDLGPRAASRSVLIRLARLDPDAVAVARATAVLGDGADLAAVAALAGIEPARAAEMSGVLAHAEILRHEAPLGFVHPLVRAAVYADLPPGERELRHQQAAEQLSEAGAPAEQVAAHLLAIPPARDPAAARVLHRAGREATVKGASDSAAAYLRRALAEPPDPASRTRIVFELGLVEALTNAPASVEHLREAYDRMDDPVAKGLAGSMLARSLLFTGCQAEAAEVASRATCELPPELTDMRAALDAFQAIAALFGFGSYEPVRQKLRGYSELDRDSLGWKFVAAIRSLDRTYLGHPADECCELAIAALEGGDLTRADSGMTVFAAINTLVFADRPEADRYWAELQAEAHQRGSLFGISGLHMWQGHALARRGELSDAEDMLLQAKDEFDLYGYGPGAHVYLRAFLGACRLDRGDVPAGRRTIEEAADPGDASDAACFWLYAKIRVLLAEGRNEDLIELADELARRRPDTVNPAIFRWRNPKAIALDRLGRRDEALALAREEVEIARGYGGPTALGHSLRVLGQLEGGADGIELLRESVGVLDGSLARLELAESLCALGTAIRLARKPSDAREPLGRALEIAGVCGAEAVVERARSELYATGARPRRDALKGVESLTPSERRVANLAAEGKSNREIAQELYVTPKTVEVHLSNAYRKLEIKGRRELATAFAPA
ncbi:MAG: helix-turn-helix transcriptional regulator [Solirubrobacterales bacterium]